MMRQIRQSWKILTAAALLGAMHAALAGPYGNDAVDDLRQALQVRVRDSANVDEIKFREANLQKMISPKVLRAGDLRRALMLQEWRDTEASSDPNIAAVDGKIRQQLVDRVAGTLRFALKEGSSAAKLAAITEIAETALTIRAGDLSAEMKAAIKKLPEEEQTAIQNRERRGGLARMFAPDLAAVMRTDPNPTVRCYAARAIGRINPPPQLAADALDFLLSRGSAAERRAAVDGLSNMLQTMLTLNKGGKSNTGGIELSSGEMADVDRVVLPVAGHGLTDPDVGVRRTATDTIRLGAILLTALVPDPLRQEFPPPNRKLTKEERDEINNARVSVRRDLQTVLPVFTVLNAQIPGVTRVVNDADPDLRQLACRALANMALARQQLLRKRDSVPDYGPIPAEAEARRHSSGSQPLQLIAAVQFAQAAKDNDPFKQDPLRAGLLEAMPLLARRAVGDPVTRVRLAAVDAIEWLGPNAWPVALTLSRGMTDPNNFVRWATARAIGKIGVVDEQVTAVTVPLLARLLCDYDLDVELAAAYALGLYGPDAAAAVPALAQAVNGGDAERRIGAIHALQGIDEPAHAAVPALTRALAHPDPRVRRTAAEALGQFGAASREAIPTLEKLLDDIDADVRKAVADAILSITRGK